MNHFEKIHNKSQGSPFYSDSEFGKSKIWLLNLVNYHFLIFGKIIIFTYKLKDIRVSEHFFIKYIIGIFLHKTIMYISQKFKSSNNFFTKYYR